MRAEDGKGIKTPEIVVNFWKEKVELYNQMNQRRSSSSKQAFFIPHLFNEYVVSTYYIPKKGEKY